jgi:mRNA interferase RelE/StbE
MSKKRCAEELGTTKYEITIARSAEKEFFSLPRDVQKRAEKIIDALKSNPRPRGVMKLRSKREIYRIRIGSYRIIYTIDDKKRLIDISYIRHRSKAYS